MDEMNLSRLSLVPASHHRRYRRMGGWGRRRGGGGEVVEVNSVKFVEVM